MQVRIKLKPQPVEGYSKEEVMSKLTRNQSRTSDSYGEHLSPLGGYVHGVDTKVRVYSIQKIGHKSVETGKTVKREHNGVVHKIKVKKTIRNHCWTGVYYDIPVSLLKVLGKKVEQGVKTWRFV